MKRIIALALAALLAASAFAACAPAPAAVSTSSGEPYAGADWLNARLGSLPPNVRVGLASDLGVDMSAFENDGYVIRTEAGDTVIAAKSEKGLDLAVRKYAKLYENGRADEIDIAYHEGYRIEKMTVLGHDLSEYSICLPDDDNGSTPFAASELQRLLAKATGVTLPIIKGDPVDKCFEFRYIADGEDGLDPDQGFEYHTEGDRVILAGKWVYGCPTCVWFFLERECGWEDLTYGDSTLAESDLIEITADCAYRSHNAFDYCLTTWTLENEGATNVTSGNGGWRNERTAPGDGINSNYSKNSGKAYMGQVRHANHGVTQFYNAYGFNPTSLQPCYSSDEDFYLIYANIIEYIENQLAAGKVIGKDLFQIDVSAADNLNYCQCRSCQKIMKEEKGTNSGVVVRFANRLEEEIDADYPGLKYLIFAYHGTNVPCITRPSDDVYVTFCLDGNCANHTLSGGQCQGESFDFDRKMGNRGFNNNDYAEWIRGWCELSDNIYVWYYGLATLQAYDLSDVLYDDLVFLRDCGVRGPYFEVEGNAYNLSRLYNYVLWRFNWDPDMTRAGYDDLVNSFLEKYYGDGWSEIREYMKIWNESESGTLQCWNCWYYSTVTCDVYDNEYFAAQFDGIVDLLERAVSLAPSALQEKRSEQMLFSALYKGCYSSYFDAYDRNDEARLAVLSERYDRAMDILRRYNTVIYPFPDAKTSAEAGYEVTTFYTLTELTLATHLEDAAWRQWIGCRDRLTYGTEQRPAPAGY